jgi:hypothetical protein
MPVKISIANINIEFLIPKYGMAMPDIKMNPSADPARSAL